MPYSMKEKVFCLERMWADGLSPRAAHRLWGSPSAESLAKWQRQADAGEIPAERPERPSHGRYCRWPQEVKDEALRLRSLGVPTVQVAERLGIPHGGASQLIAAWRRQRERASMAPEARAMAKRKKAPSALEEENRRLLLENAALREMVRDPKAGGPASLSNRRKAECVGRLREASGFRLKDLLTSFKISKSSYEYARRASGRPPREPEGLRARVRGAFEASGGTYGYRRVMAAVESGADGGEPMRAPERAVRRIMREEGLSARRRGPRRRWSSYAGEPDGGRPANVPRERALARRAAGGGFRLAHDFSAARPGELLVTDVTEFSMNGWKLYLSPFIDCWDGMPVSWRTSRHPDSALCDGSLEDALDALDALPGPRGGVVAHTDGGACYGSRSWREICERRGAARSMSRRATCPDNARAEGFFGTLKREFLHPRCWDGVGWEEFDRELGRWLGWYVDGRLKAFREGGRTVYMTIAEHRRLHGYPVG